MKYMILSDIEGVTGVTTYEQAEKSAYGVDMLMNDLSATIEGLLGDGSSEIIVYDEHTDGRNVRLPDLPAGISLVCGKPLVGTRWKGTDESFTGLVMVGFHARAGTEGALLPHSYAHWNTCIRINGTPVGEIGVEAAMAGDNDVPLLMVVADSAGAEEAERLVSGVTTVTVKQALGEFEAVCYPPKKTYQMILEAASRLAANPPNVKPLKFASPVEIAIEFVQGPFLDAMRHACPSCMKAENMVVFRGNTVTEAWMQYLRTERRIIHEV